jgi:hypothetical protein
MQKVLSPLISPNLFDIDKNTRLKTKREKMKSFLKNKLNGFWYIKYCRICESRIFVKLDEESKDDMCKECKRDSNLNKIFDAC